MMVMLFARAALLCTVQLKFYFTSNICYSTQICSNVQCPTSTRWVDTRVSFVRNSQEFYAKRLYHFAKNASRFAKLVIRETGFQHATPAKRNEILESSTVEQKNTDEDPDPGGNNQLSILSPNNQFFPGSSKICEQILSTVANFFTALCKNGKSSFLTLFTHQST